MQPFRWYSETAMAAITLKNVPDDLLGQLRQRAERDRRSLNQEILYLLEAALEASPSRDTEKRTRAERKHRAEQWARLAGLWRSDESAEDEIAAIYAARTEGREVDL